MDKKIINLNAINTVAKRLNNIINNKIDIENKRALSAEEELNNELKSKADKSEIPNIDGLASESYVNQQINAALGDLKFVILTQSQYDSLPEKDPSTVYMIINE